MRCEDKSCDDLFDLRRVGRVGRRPGAGFGRGSLSSEDLRKGFGHHDENQEQASR